MRHSSSRALGRGHQLDLAFESLSSACSTNTTPRHRIARTIALSMCSSPGLNLSRLPPAGPTPASYDARNSAQPPCARIYRQPPGKMISMSISCRLAQARETLSAARFSRRSASSSGVETKHYDVIPKARSDSSGATSARLSNSSGPIAASFMGAYPNIMIADVSVPRTMTPAEQNAKAGVACATIRGPRSPKHLELGESPLIGAPAFVANPQLAR